MWDKITTPQIAWMGINATWTLVTEASLTLWLLWIAEFICKLQPTFTRIAHLFDYDYSKGPKFSASSQVTSLSDFVCLWTADHILLHKSSSFVRPLHLFTNWKGLSIWIVWPSLVSKPIHLQKEWSCRWPSLVTRPIHLLEVSRLFAKPSSESYPPTEHIEVVCCVTYQSQSIWSDKSYLLCHA